MPCNGPGAPAVVITDCCERETIMSQGSAPCVPGGSDSESGRMARKNGFRGKGIGLLPGAWNPWQKISPDFVSFKTSPCHIETFLGYKRPYVGRCCDICTPNSRELLFTSTTDSMGLRNVIFVNENHTRYRGWLARQVCYILFVNERDVAENKYPKRIVEKILKHKRVQKAFSDSAIGSGSKGKAAEREKRNAKRILSRMVATVSPFLLRLTGWVLLKLFNSFFSIVLVHNGQLNIVKQAANEANVPLIFLPIHKSHIDYLLITFILFCHNLQAPFIASGDNLNLPIIGFLIQRLGGFFIKRRLQEENGHKDVLYKSLLNAYIEQLFHERQSLEIFLEGTRSRSGMPGLPKAGLLSILVDALYSGIVNDALIVPVGIAYDRILEGNFSREQLGQPKKSESLLGIFRGVLRMLRKNYGCVRVDFAQPFSIKEYLQTVVLNLPPSSQAKLLMPSIFDDSDRWILTSQLSQPTPVSTQENSHRQIVASLATHVLHTAVQSSAIMSTNAVACLLLYKHRKGVLLPVLLDDFQWLKEQVLVRGFDVGFSGRPEDVVMHAMHLLGEALTVNSGLPMATSPSIHAPPRVATIIPSTTVPLVFDLSYYSNSLLPVFACEAVVACALNAAGAPRIVDLLNGKCIKAQCVRHSLLLHRALQLSTLLFRVLPLGLPCHTKYQLCSDTIQKLIDFGILVDGEEDRSEATRGAPEHTWISRMDDALLWDNDEESDGDYEEEHSERLLKLSSSKDNLEFLIFLQNLLGPIIEAYSSVAIFLQNFSSQLEDTVLIAQTHGHLLSRIDRRVSVYAESATYSLVKNAITTFLDMGVLQESQGMDTKLLSMSDSMMQPTRKQRLADFISLFAS
uniref:glycerol-3-phosphate acyltransferase 1, mitochondrial isoform X2 n=1 Tax=Myxine glutinosa TaxID=7769 RepID=UPI00358DEF0D